MEDDFELPPAGAAGDEMDDAEFETDVVGKEIKVTVRWQQHSCPRKLPVLAPITPSSMQELDTGHRPENTTWCDIIVARCAKHMPQTLVVWACL